MDEGEGGDLWILTPSAVDCVGHNVEGLDSGVVFIDPYAKLMWHYV